MTQLSAFVSRTLERRPLGPIDLEEIPETPEVPRRRLKKRDASPAESERSDRLSASPTPSKIKKAAKASHSWSIFEQPKPAKPARKLGKSEFIEGEAEESDDDAMMGFGGPTRDKGDEEDDGEDQDQTLTELVDDAQMDDETLGADKVLEKVRYVLDSAYTTHTVQLIMKSESTWNRMTHSWRRYIATLPRAR